jgi:hypothetical protein
MRMEAGFSFYFLGKLRQFILKNDIFWELFPLIKFENDFNIFYLNQNLH